MFYNLGMRIGIDARLWSQTGVGRYIRNLVLNLQNLDKENEYTLFVRPKDYDKVKIQISNPKFRISKINIKWHSLGEQARFPAILDKEKLDLMHFPYFSVPVFYKRPYIVTIHDLIINHFPTGKASTLSKPLYESKLLAYKYVIKKAAKNSKKIIAVSNATKDEIIDHLGVSADKVKVIYNGIEEEFKNQKPKIKNKDYGMYFLYVGNAYPHKNLERLIQAFSKVKFQETGTGSQELKLVLVGKRDFFYQRLEKDTRAKNIKNVEFRYDVDDENLLSLYANALALAFPSLMEGFGLPALEAMACGCPVLASETPSLREVCKDAALYFNPNSTDSIKDSLEFIIGNLELRDKMIEKGRKRAKEFSWKKAAQETLLLYQEILNS